MDKIVCILVNEPKLGKGSWNIRTTLSSLGGYPQRFSIKTGLGRFQRVLWGSIRRSNHQRDNRFTPSLVILGVDVGDQMMIPCLTIATANVVRHISANPVLADGSCLERP